MSLSTGERTAIAAEFAAAKIRDYLPWMSNRYRSGDSALHRDMEAAVTAIHTAPDNNVLRVHEVACTRRVFGFLLRDISPSQERSFASQQRDTRGVARLNALLNFRYHLLATRISGLLRAQGLNPY